MGRPARRLRSVVRLAMVTVGLALAAAASAISFTVQVIAVSDQDGAVAIYRDLARDGFPAYVVRTTGAQGDVYRVRVGAFANRSAALRYAESMPDVAGSRPVPALAEAIPLGIMPLAPRLLWQHEWTGEDVRMLPWPGGIAVRVQRVDPLRQATYLVFQDGVERRFEAWAAIPLRHVPELPDIDPIGVPMVDLRTLPDDPIAPGEPEPDPGAADPDADPDDPVADPDAGPGAGPGEGLPADAGPAGDDVDAVDDGADGAVDRAVDDPIDVPDFDGWSDAIAAPDDVAVESGLALLRDRSLWPPSWETDEDEVRTAFRGSLETIVARALDVETTDVRALSYLPGGQEPPALITLDVTDASARDRGQVVALADPHRGLRPMGAEIVVPGDGSRDVPAWPATRVRPELEAEGAIGGGLWEAVADDGFVRLTLADGATWRAGVGAPIWSDGSVVLAWDGQLLLLYDFVPR